MLLEESLKEFLFECEVRKYTPKTIRGYRNGLNFLVNYLKQEHQLTNLEDIQTRHLKAFFMYQSKRGRKETYLNGLLKTFRAFFKYQMGAENITTNPVLKVSWMKEPKTIIKTFRDSEVKGMLQAYSGSDYYSVRNRAIMAMLFDTGIRCYELCTLSKAAIKDNYIVIYGKGKKERQVGLSPYLSKILMKYDRIKEYNFEFKNIRIDNYFLLRIFSIGTAIQRKFRCTNTRLQKTHLRHTARNSTATTILLCYGQRYRNGKLIIHTPLRERNKHGD